MLLNIIPLISNETINKFLCYLQGFLNEGFIPDFLKFLFLLFIIALVYLFGFSWQKLGKIEPIKLVDYVELWISVWASLTSFFLFISIVLYVLVTRESFLIWNYLRSSLRIISYGGMVISIGLTFPVVKKETRQNFMRKVFLEDDLLKKPYKRFLIFFILLSFGALDYFLKRISGWGEFTCSLVVFITMQFFLVYTYTFIKRNFFFFFGTIETTCIAPVKKKQILPVSESPKTTRRTYIRAGEVKKIFWCLLQKKLNQKKNIRVFSRDVFESWRSVAHLYTDIWLARVNCPHYLGHQKELITGLHSKLHHPLTGERNLAFWDEVTMVNLSNRINNIEHELQYYRAIKPVSGWYGSYKHSLVLAKIEGLSRQNCQLSIIRNTQKENVIAFMEANPSLSRAEVEKYAMNAVNVVLVENQHEVKYAKEYVTIALVLTGGYVGYKCITYVQPDAPQDQPEKSLMYQALKQLPGGAPPLEKNPEHLTLLEKISRIEL